LSDDGHSLFIPTLCIKYIIQLLDTWMRTVHIA
jgi:hypothetical protein